MVNAPETHLVPAYAGAAGRKQLPRGQACLMLDRLRAARPVDVDCRRPDCLTWQIAELRPFPPDGFKLPLDCPEFARSFGSSAGAGKHHAATEREFLESVDQLLIALRTAGGKRCGLRLGHLLARQCGLERDRAVDRLTDRRWLDSVRENRSPAVIFRAWPMKHRVADQRGALLRCKALLQVGQDRRLPQIETGKPQVARRRAASGQQTHSRQGEASSREQNIFSFGSDVAWTWLTSSKRRRRILPDDRPDCHIGSDGVTLGHFAERRCHAGKVTRSMGGIDFLVRAVCIISSMHAEIIAASVNKKRCTGPVRIAYS